jgi:two-component system cell cycle response regulator
MSGDTTQIDIKTRKPASKKRDPEERKVQLLFTVIKGTESDFGKTFIVDKKRISIGRTDDNYIVINDPMVSKHHCQMRIVKDSHIEQIIVTDLNSTNGTHVNGELAEERILRSGDKIGIGSTVLRFSFNDEIEEEYHARLFTFATTDSLTGFYNRRYILTELENQSRIAKRNRRVFSIFLLDIDGFKEINDTFGHLVGDEIIKKIAFCIKRNLREQDFAGRFGGDEFMIILPETEIGGALILGDRVRSKIEDYAIPYQGREIRTTITGSIGQYGLHANNSTQLLQVADRALCQAKKQGKNRIVEAGRKS